MYICIFSCIISKGLTPQKGGMVNPFISTNEILNTPNREQVKSGGITPWNLLMRSGHSKKYFESKKSPTGSTERTPKPEYLIALNLLRGPLVRSHSIFDGFESKNLSIFLVNLHWLVKYGGFKQNQTPQDCIYIQTTSESTFVLEIWVWNIHEQI